PVNGGRGVSGITDGDNAGCADPVNRGRGGGRVVQVQPVYQQQGITDRDGGPCADPGGGGRGYSGLTDSDGGHCSDPGGRGRTGYWFFRPEARSGFCSGRGRRVGCRASAPSRNEHSGLGDPRAAFTTEWPIRVSSAWGAQGRGSS